MEMLYVALFCIGTIDCKNPQELGSVTKKGCEQEVKQLQETFGKDNLFLISDCEYRPMKVRIEL